MGVDADGDADGDVNADVDAECTRIVPVYFVEAN